MDEIIHIDSQEQNGKELIEITDDIIATAERRIERITKLKLFALKSTNSDDWIDQNGRPYLTGSGAEKVARLFGVKIKDVKSEKRTSDDEKGKFYYYLVTGTAMLKDNQDSIEAVGTCSSKDQFFAKRNGVLLPLSEVDETNILKSAYTNFVVNSITRLLGIRNMTWEELNSVGINKEKVAKVEYKSNAGVISEPQRKRLYAIAKSAGWSEESFKEWLFSNYGYESSKDIKRSDYEKIVETCQKDCPK